MSIKWLEFALLVFIGLLLFWPNPDINIGKDPGIMYVSIQCTSDGRGVTYCRDSKTGRTWYITTSDTGTHIGT